MMDEVIAKHRVMRSPEKGGPQVEFAAGVPFRPRDEDELKQLREAGVLYEEPVDIEKPYAREQIKEPAPDVELPKPDVGDAEHHED